MKITTRCDVISSRWRFEIRDEGGRYCAYFSEWRYTTEQDAKNAAQECVDYAVQAINDYVKNAGIKAALKRSSQSKGANNGNTKGSEGQQDQDG